MSDQVAKPDEGMNNDVLEIKDEEVVDTGAEAGEETNTNTQDAPAVEKQEKTDVVKVEKDTAEGETETKASEDASSVQRPKEMLKVNRKGCETRQKSDASILPDSDNPHEIRKQVRISSSIFI